MKNQKTNGSYIPMFLFPWFFSSIGLVAQWGENELNISVLPKNLMMQVAKRWC